MKDNCYIDDVSTWNRFGVWVTKGGYSDLLVFPPLVDPDKNDWPEEDGIEVDLTEPHLQEKEITVSFLASRPEVDVNDFIHFISKPGYHTLNVPSLQREWQIRLSTQTANKRYLNACDFALKFVEDRHVRRDAAPVPGLPVRDSGYELDGVSFAGYGVVVDEAKDNLLKSPTAKKNLSSKISTKDGQTYDAAHLVFNSKEVTFKCHFKAASMPAFWSCYDAFFAALVAPEERNLYVEYIGDSLPCHYKRSSGFRILKLSDPVIVEFNLTLIFTVFRIGETEYLLSSEDDFLIETEDGEYYIDMKYYGN